MGVNLLRLKEGHKTLAGIRIGFNHLKSFKASPPPSKLYPFSRVCNVSKFHAHQCNYLRNQIKGPDYLVIDFMKFIQHRPCSIFRLPPPFRGAFP